MHKLLLTLSVCAVVQSTPLLAQSIEHVAVPAVAFVGKDVSYNETGTAAFFRQRAFAPLSLPDNAKLVGFDCGLRTFPIHGIKVSLRRNEPQQANVELDNLGIPKGGDGRFQFKSATQVSHPDVNNGKFNYYLVAEVLPKSANVSDICNGEECLVGACQVAYRVAR
jgi:hypothetical protein